MKKNKDIRFEQVTCVEHLEDNDMEFNSLINQIKSGCQKDVVDELKSWPKSDLDIIHYNEILKMAEETNETIVYDDFNYLLTANENIIVLYQRI